MSLYNPATRKIRPLLVFMVLASLLAGPLGVPASAQAAASPPAGIQPAPATDLNAIDPPTISLGGLGEAMIGSAITFTITFDNEDPENETGYGPFVEFELPTIGADGAGAATDDGLTFVSASYLSSPIPAGDLFVTTFDSFGNATHPLVRDASGAYINVTGTAGNQLVVVRLPFGSFTPDQPEATLSVTVQMSDLADLGTPLTIRARGGYQYGFTPLDDWCCGDTAIPTLSSYTTGSVVPTVMTLAKSYAGPGNTSAETASGPNFTRQYTVTVTIASGQETRIADLTITDELDDNQQYLPTASASPGGYTLVDEPVPGAAQSPPDNDLIVRWTSLPAGTSSAATTFSFFIPRDDASGIRAIDPATGAAVSTCNQASVTATWTPLDTRDAAQAITLAPPGCEHTLTDRSLATQKEVSVLGGGSPAPGQTLVYTLEVQVSDFFAFDDLSLEDVISDGQSFDATFPPSMSVSGNGFDLPAASMTSYTVASNKDLSDGPPPPPTENPATDGTTTVTFDLAAELAGRANAELPAGPARDHALLGRLLGGCVPLGGSTDPDCGSTNDSGTTVTIVFQTVIDQDFSDDYPSGDWSVDQGDILRNRETVTGQLLDTLTFSATGLPTVSDDAAASLTLGTGALSKAVYAINGTLCPDAVVCPAGGPYRIKPGDRVTYRITYVMPISDEENLEFTDYLPLPIFNATEISAFNPVGQSGAPGVIPAAGAANFGPFDTFYTYSGRTPTLTTSLTNNSVNFYYGDYDDPRDQPTTVDLLFTVTVSNDPFADGLYLTNQAHAYEGSTNGGLVTANAIVQLILSEPVLVTSKSAIWTDNPAALYFPTTPAPPVTFLDPTNSPRWSGTINSTNLYSGGASTIDHDVSGVDAGDIVTFAIVIENQGSSLNGAFDITILDTLPANFQVPTGGLNLQIYYGNGLGPITYTRPDESPAAPGDLFTTGIRLDDPIGSGVCQAHDPNLGNNIILITYDLEVSGTVAPGTLTNIAAITQYAGDEGGANHVPTPSPINDDANATTLTAMTKTLTGTEIDTASNNATQAVIGELATYTLVVTVPEGTVPAARIVDTLDAGLAFMDLTSVVVSDPDTDGAGPDTGLSSSVMTFDPLSGTCTNCNAGLNPTIDPSGSDPGRVITFDLGDLTNTDRVNATPETITLTYQVVVLNTSGNQHGSTRNNSAIYSWTGGSWPAVSANNVTVIEPVVNITKGIVPGSGDAGDPFTYTITISGPTITDAYEVSLDDAFPALMENMLLTGVTDSAAIVTLANFNFNPATNLLSTVTPWDMPISAAPRTITLTFTGAVSYLANPQQQIDNLATVRWTSLDGDFSAPRSAYNSTATERNGSGAPAVNDYRASNPAAAARFTVDTIATDKYVVLTSEPSTPEGTSPWYVTVGEVVRFRIIVPIPEGTSPNFQVRDNLPEGLTFLNDGTVRLSFVANGAGITSSTVGMLPVLAIPGGCTVNGNSADANLPSRPLLCTLDTSNIGSDSSIDLDPDSFATGSEIYFKLGSLLNSDSDGDQEFVVIEFNALVDNTSTGSNDAGDERGNDFDVFIGGSLIGSTSTSAPVRIAEPSITDLTKTAVPASGDAGDQITYQLTFSNSNGVDNTTAFDVHISDRVPDRLTFNAGSLNVSSTGNCATGISDNTVAPDVDIRIAVVPAGCSVTVTYTATLDDTVTPEEVLTNTANITYTSLPGSGTPLGPDNQTGSITPGASGTDTGARNGSLPPIVAPNDYQDQAIANLTVSQAVITKQITTTSAVHTTGSDVAIGEEITYAILLTFPEGTTPADTVIDDLPSGLEIVPGTPEIISTAATSGGLLSADFNGTIGTLNITPVAGDDGSVQFDFTNVIVNGDNHANNNTILLRFRARVTNILANQANHTLSNVASNQVGSNPAILSNLVEVTVVEPSITFGKTIEELPTPLDAGGVVHYRITYANASGTTVSSAMDVHITDNLAAALLLPSTGAPHIAITTSGTVGAITNNSTPSHIDITIASVAPGGSVTVDFYPVIQASASPGQIIDNLGNSAWTSLSGTLPGERDGSDGLPGPGVLNDYAATSPAVSFTIADPLFSKTIDHTSAVHTVDPAVAIGETITFNLEVTLPEGTTPGITIDDDLPAGLRYVLGSASLDTTGFHGTVNSWSVSPILGPVGSGDDLQITIGQVDVAADNNPANNTFRLTFEAVVLDEVGNQTSPPPLTNSATMTVGTDTFTDTQEVNIVEAALQIVKSVDDDLPAPGQTITFSVVVTNPGTVTAFDAIVTDNLPAGLDLTATSFTAISGVSGVLDNSDLAADDVLFTIDTFPAGGTLTITYQATVTAPFGTALNNTASLSWTSLPGFEADERTGADGPGGTLDDYAVNSSTALNSDRNLVKTLDATDFGGTAGTDVTIGEILTYQLVLTIPAASTDTYSVVDSLPAGLAFVDCEDILADADLTSSTIPLNAPGNCAHGINPGVSNPLIANSGGTVTFDFGTVTNTHPADTETITIRYRVTILDVVSNDHNTPALNNSAEMTWSVGAVTRTTPGVTIIEPDLNLEKTVDRPEASPGMPLVYSIRIFHTADSQMDGFDVIVNDVLPFGLDYVPGTLHFVTGSGVAPTSLDDTLLDPATGRILLRAVWDSLPLGTEATIQFTARLGNLPAGGSVTNEASVEWTSLPGLVPAPPATYLSAYEQPHSHERRYDPLNPADVYRVISGAGVATLALPDTGFAPGQVTVLPQQPADQAYLATGDLRLEIPRLDLDMPIIGIPINDDGWNLTWLWNQAGHLAGTAYPGNPGNAVLTAHVYLPSGAPGPFVNLGSLRWGDQIVLHANGQRYLYEVRTNARVLPNDLAPLRHEEYPWLTLITCQSYNETTDSYRYRLVVRAVLIRIEAEP